MALDILPRYPGPLIGREGDLRAARELLLHHQVRLLTLTGPPGAGKTRLAVAVGEIVADAFPDGVRFIDLSPLQAPDDVVRAIAGALGVRAPEGALRRAIIERLAGKRMLVLLDNFEHVLGAAPLLGAVLSGSEGSSFLVTSRVALQLSWEHQQPLPPLATSPVDSPADEVLRSPAAALFIERARAVRPNLTFDGESVHDLAEVCARLEGLPLAIEIAAARVNVFSPGELSRRLSNRLEFLEGGVRDAPERHSTLRAAIGWSYGLLTSDEQRAFRQLGVFVGGCEAVAAEKALSRMVARPSECLRGLIQSNLVNSVTGDDGSDRLSMLETIREYALECLVAAGEAHDARQRHAEQYLDLAQLGDSALSGPRQRAWLERLDTESGNLSQAFGHFAEEGQLSKAAELAASLWRFWWMRGHLAAGRELVAGLLALPGIDRASVARAQALFTLGALAVWQSDYAEARNALRETADIARDAEPALLAYALTFLGRISRDLGAVDAGPLGAEAVELFRTLDDRWGLGLALHFLGLSVMSVDLVASRPHFEESAAIFRSLGVRGDLAMPLRGLGMIAYQERNLVVARACLEESATYFRDRADTWSVAMVHHDLGYVAYAQRRWSEAASLFAGSLRAWRILGNRRGQLACLVGMAGVAAESGDAAQAAALLGAVDAMAQESGIVLEPTAQNTLDRIRERTLLGSDAAAFDDGWWRGRAMDLETAVTRGIAVAERRYEDPGRPAAARQRDLVLLTRREREVAALVRMGLTNRQIAATLVISEGTASLHVKHILAKLGFHSRAQVAAWAARHDFEDSDRN